MEEQVLQTIARHKMLRQGDTVAVGVSGGADSVALLCFLYENRARWNLTLRVCHLNHSLRGEESLRDQRFVEDLARDLGLEFCLAVADAAGEARLRGLSVEEAARELRYDFFRACAGPDGKIATAHTRSDSMETLLLNLTRGTGVRGLRGIPPVRDKIIRPLSDVTRQEVLDYCGRRGLSYVHDSSNDTLDYTRNRLRHQVLPVLGRINPGLPGALARLMARMGDQWAMTVDLADRAQEELRRGEVWDREGLLRLYGPVRECLLQRMLEEADANQSARMLSLMEDILARGTGAVEVAGGVYFYAEADRCGLRRRPEEAPAFCLPIPREALLKGGIYPAVGKKRVKIAIFHSLAEENPEKINKRLFNNALDCDRIKDNVTLRTKKDGDRIFLAGGAGTRLLKKYYQEAGIPPGERARMLVLADRDGPLWAEGLGVHRRAAPGAQTAAVLTIDVLEGQEDG